jgi:hypothetical protein
LQACADAMVQNFVNDRWIIRRLPAMTRCRGLHRDPAAQPRVRPDHRPRLPAQHRRPRRGRPGRCRPHRPRTVPGPQVRGPPPQHRAVLLRVHRLRQPHGEKARLTGLPHLAAGCSPVAPLSCQRLDRAGGGCVSRSSVE